MAIFNSAVNFVIYVLTSPKFRHHLAGICAARLQLKSSPIERVVTRLRRSEHGPAAAAGNAETVLLYRLGEKDAPVQLETE